jgi:hypothetical protein
MTSIRHANNIYPGAENSSKIIHAITWHRSPSSVSSSYRSELGASSNSLSWTDKSETKSDMFEDYGGMKSGSHSQTLGRLYAWEKKLYEEVKVGLVDCSLIFTRLAYVEVILYFICCMYVRIVLSS